MSLPTFQVLRCLEVHEVPMVIQDLYGMLGPFPPSFIETLRGEPYQVPFVIDTELGQYHSSGLSGGIWVPLNKDRGQCNKVFKFLSGILLVLGPSPHLSILHELKGVWQHVRILG